MEEITQEKERQWIKEWLSRPCERDLQDTRDDPSLSGKCCIYRVPPTIRRLNPEAYTPTIISIGPLHHSNERLKDMESHKDMFLKRFRRRAQPALDDLSSFLIRSKAEVCASYSCGFVIDKRSSLAGLLLKDAAFIIQLFLDMYLNGGIVKDVKLSQPWLLDTLTKDLLLLENQLPFFFLEELFNILYPSSANLPSFLQLTYFFFRHLNVQNLDPHPAVGINHFTDLLRLFHLPKGELPERPSYLSETDVLLYGAKELEEAGVKFKVSGSKCLLDLRFSGSVLELPQIFLGNNTGILFCNMIAFEQCHHHSESYVTDYALLMDFLINSEKDVEVLIRRKIIRNFQGDANDVARIFNGLWKKVVQRDFNYRYIDVCKRLNEYYEGPWHRFKANFRRQIVIAGTVLFFLSLIQTILTILQVLE